MLTVLVVENDPLILRAHERLLRGKHTTHLAENGVEALKLIDSGIKFDAVVSDLEMPKMPGDVLCLELRRRKLAMPFMLLSGSDAVERIAKLVGATEFAMKGSSSLIPGVLGFLKKVEELKALGKKTGLKRLAAS